MFVTYTPANEQPQEWEFRPGKVRAARMAQIQKVYKRLAAGEMSTSWKAWVAAVQEGSIPALQVLLWHLITLDHPTVPLRPEDIDFADDELVLSPSRAEMEERREVSIRAAREAQNVLDADALNAIYDAQVAAAKEGSEGKAPVATSSPSSTSIGPDSSRSPESRPTSSPTD